MTKESLRGNVDAQSVAPKTTMEKRRRDDADKLCASHSASAEIADTTHHAVGRKMSCCDVSSHGSRGAP